MSPALLPPLVLAVGGLTVLCLGAVLRGRASRLPPFLSLAAVLGAGAFALLGSSDPHTTNVAGLLDASGFSRYFVLLSCALTLGVLLFAEPYGRRRGLVGEELFGLILWACLGMVLTASATSWVTFFLGYELLSLCLYVLVALPKSGTLSGEAGLKYFFVGAVASAFLAFGIAVLYAATGTLDIAGSVADAARLPPAAAVASGAQPWARLGFAFVLVGIAFKLSLAPFHLWVPDVYQGAPAPVTALLASGSKVALFAVLVRLALSAGDALWAVAAPTLSLLGVMTVVVGNVGALTQTRAKRLLAYSSVAQMGYLVLALAASRAGGAVPALFYVTVYASMDLGAFGLLGSLSAPGREGDLDVLTDLRGVGYSHPWRAAALVACLLSLAGLPPAAGFIGKVSIFLAVFRAGLLWSALLALATTVAAAYLYLRIAVTLYTRPSDDSARALPIPEADLGERLAAGAVLFVILILGIVPSPLFSALGRILLGVLILSPNRSWTRPVGGCPGAQWDAILDDHWGHLRGLSAPGRPRATEMPDDRPTERGGYPQGSAERAPFFLPRPWRPPYTARMLARTRWRVVEKECEPDQAPAVWREAEARGAVGAVTSWGAGIGKRRTIRLYWEAHPGVELPEGEDLVEENWTPYWRDSLGVVPIGPRMALVPAWEEHLPDVPIVLRVDPGMAFGAGDHPTTRLCLKLLDLLAATRSLPWPVLDVGAGTGVLSLGAAFLGAGSVDALDIDPFCFAACRRNAALNGLETRIRPVLRSLDLLEQRYPLVMANLVASQLETLAPNLLARLSPDGLVLLSGFQLSEEERVRALFAAQTVIELREEEDGWLALLARREPMGS